MHRCPKCGGPLKRRRRYEDVRWICACGIHVHSDEDGSPNDVMTDQRTRNARMAAHRAFDRLWRDGHLSRNQAYRAMQRAFRLSSEQGHMSKMSAEQCEAVVKWANAHRKWLRAQQKPGAAKKPKTGPPMPDYRFGKG